MNIDEGLDIDEIFLRYESFVIGLDFYMKLIFFVDGIWFVEATWIVDMKFHCALPFMVTRNMYAYETPARGGHQVCVR